ncbi:hypothetical protein GCM10010990_03390 [Croceicoccus mobilis]|uniref:Uncharacterized protein n=1 Tax=Croceicoccus mobilis TaxID=1703339 RepID=A0A917DQN1_9SPHN|nr:hypothetical protein GCM10010990_03390 [Croceicoccus mobilis]
MPRCWTCASSSSCAKAGVVNALAHIKAAAAFSVAVPVCFIILSPANAAVIVGLRGFLAGFVYNTGRDIA